MAQFQFELVSPEAKIMSENVTMAVIPGGDGDFGVLSGHAPLISTVRTGVVDIYLDNMNDKTTSIFVAGGFADVTSDGCTLLAEQAVNVNDIDAADVAKKITDVTEKLKLSEGNADKRRFQKQLDVLTAMQLAAA